VNPARHHPSRKGRARELARWARFVLALWLAVPGLQLAAATLDAGASDGFVLCTVRGFERVPLDAAGQADRPRGADTCLACVVLCAGALPASAAVQLLSPADSPAAIAPAREAFVAGGPTEAAHRPRAPPRA